MLHLFGVLPWNPEQVLFEFIFSVSLLLQKDGITVNNTVKYLTIWHLKKVVFLYSLYKYFFQKAYLWFTFIIFCLAPAFRGNS